jgi:hypothetical protein
VYCAARCPAPTRPMVTVTAHRTTGPAVLPAGRKAAGDPFRHRRYTGMSVPAMRPAGDGVFRCVTWDIAYTKTRSKKSSRHRPPARPRGAGRTPTRPRRRDAPRYAVSGGRPGDALGVRPREEPTRRGYLSSTVRRPRGRSRRASP